MSLVEFVRARLDEDENNATGASLEHGARWGYVIDGLDEGESRIVDWERPEQRLLVNGTDAPQLVLHAYRHDPARVLRQVAALRVLIDGPPEEVADTDEWFYGVHAAAREVMLQAMALIWADHEDYEEAWRP